MEFAEAPYESCQTSPSAMAYRIKRKEAVDKGLRRIVRSQLRRAAKVAGDKSRPQEERVHELRTRLKRSRAALALISKGVGRRDARKVDRVLRDNGRRLARPRDLAVQAHTFRILAARLAHELPVGLLERVRGVGERLRRKLKPKAVERDLKKTARALCRLARQAGPWRVAHGNRAVAKGVVATYKRARRAMTIVRDDPTPERFHDWRKQVKVMSNQLKIVARAVPELAATLAPKLERLGEILGQIHDLDCAAATAERHPRWFGSEADRDAVRALVAEHRVLLERDAFPLAETVFAGRARDVRELIETAWTTWRQRKQPVEHVAVVRAA
jgi:CHAD domain-containing protein